MPRKTSSTGSELFIVDNSDEDWKVLRYLHDWCQIAKGIDVATGYFEIGGLLSLNDEWQKVDHIRVLMGDAADERPGAREVCRIDAKPSPRPRFVKEDGQEKFYIRTGNASNALAMKEMFAYFSQHWPGAFAPATA